MECLNILKSKANRELNKFLERKSSCAKEKYLWRGGLALNSFKRIFCEVKVGAIQLGRCFLLQDQFLCPWWGIKNLQKIMPLKGEWKKITEQGWVTRDRYSSLHVNVWYCDKNNYVYLYHVVFFIVIEPSSVACRVLSKRLRRSTQEGSKSLDELLFDLCKSLDGCVLSMTISSFLIFIAFAPITSMPKYRNADIFIAFIDLKNYCFFQRHVHVRFEGPSDNSCLKMHSRISWSGPDLRFCMSWAWCGQGLAAVPIMQVLSTNEKWEGIDWTFALVLLSGKYTGRLQQKREVFLLIRLFASMPDDAR